MASLSILQMNLFHFVRQFARVCFGLSIIALSAGNVFAAPVTANGMPDLTPLVEKTAPAVVLIVNAVNVEQDRKQESFGEFVNRIFAGKKETRSEVPEEIEKRGASTGSGFLISPDGYILSNQHVVADADELLVKMRDGRVFKAKVLGADEMTDVALLKINGGNHLPYLKMGRSADVRAGQWVMAIGSPKGLEDSVSFGIVSNAARDNGQYLHSIQMDAAVNHGNSGGAAINLKGEVIGINSAIITTTGGFMGISLAIPIDDALKVAEQLKKNGRVTRGYIGVGVDTVTGKMAKWAGLPYTQGVLVRDVRKGFSAEKAGIEVNDIILQFNDSKLCRAIDLVRFVGKSEQGTIAHLLVWREGRKINIPVMISSDTENMGQ